MWGCSTVCKGKNIANCRKTPRFLPVMCALCRQAPKTLLGHGRCATARCQPSHSCTHATPNVSDACVDGFARAIMPLGEHQMQPWGIIGTNPQNLKVLPVGPKSFKIKVLTVPNGETDGSSKCTLKGVEEGLTPCPNKTTAEVVSIWSFWGPQRGWF